MFPQGAVLRLAQGLDRVCVGDRYPTAKAISVPSVFATMSIKLN